jgi:microsomal dipeptidase-like Zn-dependent dipeptidase
VHCVEGGFALGASEAEVRENLAELGRRGVAYVTLAHLFWRRMATDAPALPFMPDWLYRAMFRQPRDVGLSGLGHATVEAMLEARVLLDLTHMSRASIRDALRILDERDPDQSVPVIVSHGACHFGGLEYNLPEDTIAIARRGGVIGVIACRHYVTRGLRPSRPKSLGDSIELIARHADRIRDVTGSFDHVAIGTDLDGYIKPALPGLEHVGLMRELQDGLRRRYGERDAERI